MGDPLQDFLAQSRQAQGQNSSTNQSVDPAAPPAQAQQQPGAIRSLLSNFFSGAGSAMTHSVGLPTQQELEQQQIKNQLAQRQQAVSEQVAQTQEAYKNIQGEALRRDSEGAPIPAAFAQALGRPELAGVPLNKAQLGLSGKVIPSQNAATSRQNVAGINAASRESIAQNKPMSVAARDDRYIQLQGQDPSSWTPEDQKFIKGYTRYIDTTRVQPGVARANVMNGPRWAALDPNRQAQIAVARSLASGAFGNQTSSINALIGHLGDLKDTVASLGNLDQKFLNVPLNSLKDQTGDPNVTNVLAKMEPVRKEFETLLLNGHALYGDDRKSAETIVNLNSSLGQVQAAMKSLAHTGAIRMGAVNSTVKRVTGADIPELLEPASASILADFGEEIPDYQGQNGNFQNIFSTPQGPASRAKPKGNAGGGAVVEYVRGADGKLHKK